MKITLPYGKVKKVSIEVPDKNLYFVADRGEVPILKDPQDAIRKTLRNPIGSPPLSQIVNPRDRVIIVGDDITRPTPQDVIVPILLDELNAIGVPDKNIEVIIALGTHREMSWREIREKYGDKVVERVPVINHNYKDMKKLVDMGKTESGIPVSVNKKVCDADFVIGVGNIVPHLVGWAGGGKIIQPGVCGEETTMMTHIMLGKIRPITELPVGRLDNKIRKEIDAIASEAGLNFIVNTVLNQEGKIAHLVVGDPIEAFKEGVKTAGKIYCPVVPGYADIVVVSSYPADIDYWQATKPVVYASMAVKPGGTIVLVAPCPERISPTHPLYGERCTLGYNKNLKAIENREIDDLIAGFGLLVHSQILERADVICYSDGLREEDKEDLGLKHASTIEEAMEMAFRRQGGENARVGVLKCGEILPVISKEC